MIFMRKIPLDFVRMIDGNDELNKQAKLAKKKGNKKAATRNI
jgi:hypothetical protein